MANITRHVIILPANSALPRDEVELGFYTNFATVPSNTDLDNVAIDVTNLFNFTRAGQTNTVGHYLARDRDYATNAAKVKHYAMPSVPGPTGPPVHVSSWTLDSPGSTITPLPEQDAVVLSYHGTLVGVTTHLGRHKGRMFFGPFNTLALEESSGGIGAQTVSSDVLRDLTAAAAGFGPALTAHGFTWSVFSRTDWTNHDVVGGYVDDRWDTQRRRLQESSGRTLFTV